MSPYSAFRRQRPRCYPGTATGCTELGVSVTDSGPRTSVRSSRTGLLRGADADEVDVAELRGLGERCAEPEAAGLDGAGEHIVEAGLEDR